MDKPILDPSVPYIGPIYGGRFSPGKMVRIRGTSPGIAYRFSVYLQCGPETIPRDDVAVQLTVRFLDGYISLNSSENGIWGEEERGSSLPIKPAEQFEIILICDFSQYKVEINGQHYCEFPQRMHYDRITHLAIDGDVSLVRINYETALLEGDNPAFSNEVDVMEEDEAEEFASPVDTENDTFEMIDFTNTMRLPSSVIRSASVVEFSQMPSYEEGGKDGSAFPVHSDKRASFSYPSAPTIESHEISPGGASSFPPTGALRLPPPPQHRALHPFNSSSSHHHVVKKSSNLLCWILCVGAVVVSIIIVVGLFVGIKNSLKP